MARPQYRLKKSTETLIEMISLRDSNLGNYLIVNKTILTSVLNLVPTDSLDRLLSNNSNELPKLGDPTLPIWIKSKRKSLGLTQKSLAARLRQLELKIHPSDIGNLETNKRKELYTIERVETVLRAINSLIA